MEFVDAHGGGEFVSIVREDFAEIVGLAGRQTGGRRVFRRGQDSRCRPTGGIGGQRESGNGNRKTDIADVDGFVMRVLVSFLRIGLKGGTPGWFWCARVRKALERQGIKNMRGKESERAKG